MSGVGAIDYAADEPRVGDGVSTLIFSDDFESYADATEIWPSNGGPWATDPVHNAGAPYAGHLHRIDTSYSTDGGYTNATGQSLRFDWPADPSGNQTNCVVEKQSVGWSGVVFEVISFYYRAQITEYGIGKKHCIYEGTNRWTNNQCQFSLDQAGGPKLDPSPGGSGGDWDTYPGYEHLGTGSAAQNAFTADVINDGNWHRYTYARLRETSTGARNGQLHVWFDGTKVLARTGLGTGAYNTTNFQLASTFNGPTSLQQSDWWDRVRVLSCAALPS